MDDKAKREEEREAPRLPIRTFTVSPTALFLRRDAHPLARRCPVQQTTRTKSTRGRSSRFAIPGGGN